MATVLELAGPRQLRFAPVDERKPERGEFIAKAVRSGISHGTELSLFGGTSPFATRRFDGGTRLFVDEADPYPFTLGYEWVGIVEDVGSGVTRFRPGDRLHLPLPHGDLHLCREDDVVSWGVVLPLPDEVTDESAIFLSQLSIALQAIHDARIIIGDSVVVFGLGVLGLLTLRLARLSGAGTVTAVEPDPDRRALGEEWGADRVLDPRQCDIGAALRSSSPGADVCIEFSGNDAALHQAIRGLRPSGRCVAAGFYQGGAGNLKLGEEWLHNRITMVASSRGWGNAHRAYPRWDRARLAGHAIELMRRGEVDPSALISDTRAYQDAPAVFVALAENPGKSLKTALLYAGTRGGSE